MGDADVLLKVSGHTGKYGSCMCEDFCFERQIHAGKASVHIGGCGHCFPVALQ